jgi:hypothetical protein
MSKVSKTNPKTGPKSTKTVVAPVSKSLSPVRLTETDKKADLETYIANPHTGKMVKRNTPQGKKLVEAEKTGEEIARTMTETERLILVVQTLRDFCETNELDLDDTMIKAALKSIEAELPRGFPVCWGGKHKEGRSPDHPKGPINAYIYYLKTIRGDIKREFPELSSKELMKIMAQQWKETDEEYLKEYYDMAAADKVRYESEMAIFEKEHPDQARNSTKSINSPGKPTKATAYGMFCDANRQLAKDVNPELEAKEITKILAENWDELKKDDSKEAEKYQKAAEQANTDFEERTKEYHTSPGSPKKLSKAEQAKADDPEHYELNMKTGRYVRKEEPKKVKEMSPKKKVVKAVRPAKKEAIKKIEKIVADEVVTDEEGDDELCIE